MNALVTEDFPNGEDINDDHSCNTYPESYFSTGPYLINKFIDEWPEEQDTKKDHGPQDPNKQIGDLQPSENREEIPFWFDMKGRNIWIRRFAQRGREQ